VTDLLSSLARIVAEPLSYRFMLSAFQAGTIVAVVAGSIGWFMVLRRQSFAGHALAVVGFPGAAGAALVGLAPVWGYFGFCLVAALVIAMAPAATGPRRAQSAAVTGTVQALALASGFLFVSLYTGYLGGVNGLLFGTFLGITPGQVVVLLVAGAATLAVLAAIARPLLFASLDPQVALARGVPVHALAVVFLLLLGAAVAEASQITGALLVFALLVAPAASAQALTLRPWLGIALSAGIGVAVTWTGLLVAYWVNVPVGAIITTLAFATYLLSRGVAAWRR
jgi:zinc/manganese transport system permease protein